MGITLRTKDGKAYMGGASNMSKLGDDGKPIRRGDGKVLKGPNYMPPYLEDLCSPFN